MAFDYVRKNANDYETVKKAYADREANSVYNKSQSVIDAERLRDEHAANKVADWTGGTYGEALKNQLDKINNREKFTYDLNGDALYQQYKDQYMNQGKLAMQDAMGQASAMTGGYGNSYAASVGNQAYQGYLQKLNDVVPELYQMAYNKYTQEGQDMKDMYSMLNNAYNTEYGEHRDKVTDWTNEQNRLDQNAYNEASMDWTKFSDNRNYFNSVYNTALDWATNDANTDYANRFANYQQQVSEQQFAQQMAAQREANNQSARIAALQAENGRLKDAGSAYAEDMAKAASSQRTKDFMNSIFSSSDLKRRGMKATINGKTKVFDDYKQYVDAVMEKWHKNGQLTENEVKYLLGKYGIEH